jgi:hypothetical protein
MGLVCGTVSPGGGSPTRLRGPTHLTLLPTYRCTAACRHCCFESNPTHERRIPRRRLLGYIREAADTFETLRLLVFSGGECFLLGEDLLTATRQAARRNLAVRCVSNGYWAVNERAARRRMERMAAAGLTEINLSTGDDHQEFVPFERVALAATAAARAGVRAFLVIEAHAASRFRAAQALEHPTIRRFRERSPHAGLLGLIQNVWIPFRSDEPLDAPTPAAAGGEGCTNVLDNVVVTPDEQMAACCGLTMEHIPELKLGSLRRHRMGDLYRSALADFLKIWLRVEGPESILSFAASKQGLPCPTTSAHMCQTCVRVHRDPGVRTALLKHWQEKKTEVLFRFHLLRELQVHAESGLPESTRNACASVPARPHRTRIHEQPTPTNE